MDKRKVIFVVVVVWILMIIGLAALNLRYATIKNRATVKTVGVAVFKDANLTETLDYIAWGVVDPNSVNTYDGYLTSESNVPITVSMTTMNWTPPNTTDFVTCTWNLEGVTVAPEEVVPMTFTLSVAANITGIRDFEFDIVLVGG